MGLKDERKYSNTCLHQHKMFFFKTVTQKLSRTSLGRVGKDHPLKMDRAPNSSWLFSSFACVSIFLQFFPDQHSKRFKLGNGKYSEPRPTKKADPPSRGATQGSKEPKLHRLKDECRVMQNSLKPQVSEAAPLKFE